MNCKTIYNIALIGCGGMAANYRKKYTQIPGARLMVVVDNNEGLAQKVAEELGVSRWSTDFRVVLEPDIDIVDISTPNFLHAQQAIAALRAGKDVILQKPITPTVEEAEDIIDIAVQTGRKVGVYMSLFDNPIFYEIKRLFEAGALGNVSNIYCRGAHNGGLRATLDNWRKSVEKTGGGAFIQLTIHYINMIQWLLQDKIKSVAAFSRNNMCPNIGGDDVTNACCVFESGILGTLESSYASGPNVLAIYGTRGFIQLTDDYKLDIMLDEVYKGSIISYSKPRAIETSYIKNLQKDDQYDQHIAFVKAIIEEKPVPIPVEIGLYDLKVVKAVYKSSKEKRVVEINEMSCRN